MDSVASPVVEMIGHNLVKVTCDAQINGRGYKMVGGTGMVLFAPPLRMPVLKNDIHLFSMAQIPEKPQRRSIRLEEYDYAQPGAYFITLVTYQRQALFGKIENGVVVLSQLGDLAISVWRGLETRFSVVGLDEFIIMPDHMHGIIIIREENVGARPEETTKSSMSSIASPALETRRK